MTRSAALIVFACIAGACPAQDDVEAKKKRLGEILRQINELQSEGDKLLRELSGGDPARRTEILRELMRKHAPEMAKQVEGASLASNERNAWATLKTIGIAQVDFRANDRDGNRVNDFWVADVSGLYRIEVAGEMIKLIEIAVGLADAGAAVPLDQAGPLPGDPKTRLALLGKSATKAGYRFAIVGKYQDEKGAAVKYDEGAGRNVSRFAICAYPAEYGKTGTATFLLNEDMTVLKKDTAGKPVEVMPADARKDGWSRAD